MVTPPCSLTARRRFTAPAACSAPGRYVSSACRCATGAISLALIRRLALNADLTYINAEQKSWYVSEQYDWVSGGIGLAYPLMEKLKAGLNYFLIVFGAGFALAFVRIPLLVPRFGIRTAELLEAPVMLLVIVLASRRMRRQHPDVSRLSRLAAGIVALALLLLAELLLAYALGNRSVSQYLASRDPISGSVYLVSLLVFAVAPALGRTGSASLPKEKGP